MTVFADVDAIDQQRDELERVQREGSPGIELRRRFRDEPATHGALAGAARGHRRRQRLETARVPSRRHAEEHLFDDPTIQRILAGHQVKGRQRHFRTVRADPRAADRDLPISENNLAYLLLGPRPTQVAFDGNQDVGKQSVQTRHTQLPASWS
jgi:hypothetical protein